MTVALSHQAMAEESENEDAQPMNFHYDIQRYRHGHRADEMLLPVLRMCLYFFLLSPSN